jgi:succinate-acetate transporter protein
MESVFGNRKTLENARTSEITPFGLSCFAIAAKVLP